MMGKGRRFAGLAGWFALLVAAIALFTLFDDPRLAPPDLTAIGTWGEWAAGRDPVFAIVAILRLVLLGLAWYLLGASSIQLVARLSRNLALVRIADALSVPLVRNVVGSALGMTLASSMVIGAATPGHQPAAPTAATATQDTADGTAGHAGPVMTALARAGDEGGAAPRMVAVPDDTGDTGDRAPVMQRTSAADAPGPAMRPATTTDHHDGPVMQPITATDPDGPVMQPITATDHHDGPVMQPVTASPTDGPLATTEDGARPTAGPSMLPALGPSMTKMVPTWVVESGDHLWKIAERTLEAHQGGPVNDDQVRPYWRRLIEANRDRLVDRDNPDLILPGQEFVLPPIEVGR